jgi:hypothetical protein
METPLCRPPGKGLGSLPFVAMKKAAGTPAAFRRAIGTQPATAFPRFESWRKFFISLILKSRPKVGVSKGETALCASQDEACGFGFRPSRLIGFMESIYCGAT